MRRTSATTMDERERARLPLSLGARQSSVRPSAPPRRVSVAPPAEAGARAGAVRTHPRHRSARSSGPGRARVGRAEGREICNPGRLPVCTTSRGSRETRRTSGMESLPESVWQWTGPNPGPHVMVVGGIHGNEVTGSMLVEGAAPRRRKRWARFPSRRGHSLALGNPCAIASNTRGSSRTRTSIRVFTDARLADVADTSYENAARPGARPAPRSGRHPVDLHATTQPSNLSSSSSTTP